MRFSETFHVVRSLPEDDWFDALMPVDTSLFVDPFLIWTESGSFWGDAHAHLINFFDMVFEMIGESKGDQARASWRQAANLLVFPEPARGQVTPGQRGGASAPRSVRSDPGANGLAAVITARDGVRHSLALDASGLISGGCPRVSWNLRCGPISSRYTVK